jgi:hypothetical protein
MSVRTNERDYVSPIAATRTSMPIGPVTCLIPPPKRYEPIPNNEPQLIPPIALMIRNLGHLGSRQRGEGQRRA